jgi:hypothetical protein
MARNFALLSFLLAGHRVVVVVIVVIVVAVVAVVAVVDVLLQVTVIIRFFVVVLTVVVFDILGVLYTDGCATGGSASIPPTTPRVASIWTPCRRTSFLGVLSIFDLSKQVRH